MSNMRVTQQLLDNVRNQLTADDVKELKVQFDLDRHQWKRAWTVSPVYNKFNLGLLRAAKEKIASRRGEMNRIISETEMILNNSVEA